MTESIDMLKIKKSFLSVAITAAALLSTTASAQEQLSVQEAAKKSANPVSDVWMLITQNDYTFLEKEDGHHEMQNRFSFQPVMPVPIMDGEWNLVNRLVANHYSSPGDREDGDFFEGRTNGMGDTVFLSLAAPNRDDGWIWGVGPTVIMPTGTDGLTQDKWQVGPAAMVARLGKETGNPASIESWNVGFLAQQWWDVGGSDSVTESTNQADIQYFLNYRVSNTALIGMTPNIQIDWTKDGSDQFTVPVGLGYIDMFKVGPMPVRWGVELQYYVMKPDANVNTTNPAEYVPYAPDWNLKFFIAPVTLNPFK
ncbi:hypothetical protein BCT58_04365 [Vibrio lentus]|uniref:Neuromedin U n=1 Tax=Vibrio lentus TaxID=136468 RepID=A0A2N7IMU2_9VIBR|nr:hypothetical protein BCU64_20225 [Vibrio lentus]PMI95909.1 hypothetical protein BCU33_14590 [Vibrio lentus]PML59554.1 hypothetical protein BCT74_03150 [Vibrio lentus]PMM29667.1 hypothetical protein BCT58_04365 [Vibrio lentus]